MLWLIGSIHAGWERIFIHLFIKQIYIKHWVPETWGAAVFLKKHQSSCSRKADIPVRDTINTQINKMHVGLAMSAKEKK